MGKWLQVQLEDQIEGNHCPEFYCELVRKGYAQLRLSRPLQMCCMKYYKMPDGKEVRVHSTKCGELLFDPELYMGGPSL